MRQSCSQLILCHDRSNIKFYRFVCSTVLSLATDFNEVPYNICLPSYDSLEEAMMQSRYANTSTLLCTIFEVYKEVFNDLRGESFITLGTGVGWNVENGQKFYTLSNFVHIFSCTIEK